jgi:CBS domain-containing membrane protein
MERVRGCLGALLGLLATALISRAVMGTGASLPLILAPVGASAVLLFAAPASPLAQPWPMMGGNLVAAVIGVTCARWVHDPALAAPLAATLAIAAMFALRCLHPPSGAVALTAVLGGPAITQLGYEFALFPVAANSLVMLVTAIAFNNATGRPYPHPQRPRPNPHHTIDKTPLERLGISQDDLRAALGQYDQVLDVSTDELEVLFQRAEMNAYHRRLGEITCAQIMSRDVIWVEFGTSLQEAWSLLRQHRIRTLPVLDPARRVIGMASDLDFMASADLDVFEGLASRFRRAISKPTTIYADRPEAVGQIMQRNVPTVREDTHIVELVPLMVDTGRRHIPVVDEKGKLSGIISQSDLVAALYSRGMAAR